MRLTEPQLGAIIDAEQIETVEILSYHIAQMFYMRPYHSDTDMLNERINWMEQRVDDVNEIFERTHTIDVNNIKEINDIRGA